MPSRRNWPRSESARQKPPESGRAGETKFLTSGNSHVLLLFMFDPAAMSERHTAILARLAEVGERLAMKHAERALAADDPEVEAKATAAFHRAARSVRQWLALEAKLARDARRADAEERERAAGEAGARRERRRAEVREAVTRLIWTEAEDETHVELLEAELDDLLERELFPDDEPAEVQVARLSRAMGLASDDETAANGADPSPRWTLGCRRSGGRRPDGEPLAWASSRCHRPLFLMDDASLGVSACQGRAPWRAAWRPGEARSLRSRDPKANWQP
jgi:hypothetical protein